MNGRPATSPGVGELHDENQKLRALVEELERCKRRAEEALVESTSRLTGALRTAGVATWDWSPASNVITASETLAQVCGLQQDGEPFGAHLIHPEDRQPHRATVDAALSRGEGWQTEYRIHRPVDGAIAWLEERASVVRHRESGEMFVTGLVWDITARKQSHLALRESEARLQAVANVVPDLLWSNDAAGHTDWVNDRWLAYTGLTCEQAVGNGWQTVIHPDDLAALRADRANMYAAGKPLRHEHRIRSAAGEYRWFLIQAEPLLDDQGRVIRWFGAAADIHEQRTARDLLELRVAGRTRELQELSAQRQQLLERLVAATEEERQRIARELHDEMGQHLTALKVSLESLVAPDPAIARMKEIVARLDTSVDRLALELRPPALDDVGLCGAVSSLVEQFVAGSGIHVDVHLIGKDEQGLPDAIETAVYRVLQEALTNAWKHAAVTTISVILEKSATQLQLIVEDRGRGFDVERTVAEASRQGHFGLLGMRERAALVGGSLHIESGPGHGTTVYVRVPLGHPSGEGS